MRRAGYLALTVFAGLSLAACGSSAPEPTDAMLDRYDSGCPNVDRKFAELEAAMSDEMGESAVKIHLSGARELTNLCGEDGKIQSKHKKENDQYVDDIENPDSFDEGDEAQDVPDEHAFGETSAEQGDVIVTVKNLEPTQATGLKTEEGKPVDESKAYRVTFLIENNGSSAINLKSDMHVDILSGDASAPLVVADGGNDGTPSEDLLYGASVDFALIFEAKDPDDVQVGVSINDNVVEYWNSK